MQLKTLIVFLAGFALFQAGMTASVQAQASDQPTGTISIEDSAEQDAAIATRIREILSELDGFEDVTVTVSSGIVTLRGTTIDSAAVNRLNEIAGRVQGVVTIQNEVEETTDVGRRLDPALNRFRARTEQFVNYLPLAGVALAAFALVVFVGFAIARLQRPWDRFAPNAFIADIYRQIIRIAFIVAGLVVSLDILGAAALLSTILGAAGIVGLAIGFAVRDTVENFIASIMLSIRQPFRPNDTVEIEGDTGKVIRLTSRATILLSFDGNHIRIPNSTVFKSRIVNFTRNDERRFVIDMGVSYDSDLVMVQDSGVADRRFLAVCDLRTGPGCLDRRTWRQRGDHQGRWLDSPARDQLSQGAQRSVAAVPGGIRTCGNRHAGNNLAHRGRRGRCRANRRAHRQTAVRQNRDVNPRRPSPLQPSKLATSMPLWTRSLNVSSIRNVPGNALRIC